ncbi:MAG: hypothetical protein ACI30A_00655 [Paludibacteraceae bacterium]
MKKFIAFLCASLMLIACTTNKQSINSKDLQGKYEIDFSSFLSDLAEDEEEDAFATAFAAMLLSQMQMTMQFDGDKLIIDASGAARNLINAFGGEEAQMPIVADYKIQNDSILYTKVEGEEFSEVGVLRKMGDSYDYLQLVTEDEGKEISLTMRKQAEK